MQIINKQRIRDEKIAQLLSGRTAYAESQEMIRLVTRSIERNNIHVHLDKTNMGCWFIPLDGKHSS
ncbi:hypothetical protein [Virgibacillus siamensis]|uniref:hypothetical protein n=1 Tax=Virgibacillus siamensis TaxID=480071 RepID=UPI000984DC17|nr:hypothetical protein [Virgibacillus siamensis]